MAILDGIWVLSSKDDLSFNLVDSIYQAITFFVRRRNVTWFCSAVYASPIFSIRSALWSHLIDLRNNINGS